MEFLQSLNNNTLFNLLASTASIVSVIITTVVYLNIKNIRKHYIFIARIPELSNNLSEIASSISERLDTFNGFTTIIFQFLADAEINLKSLSKKSNGELKKSANALIGKIKQAENKSSFFDKITFNLYKKDLLDVKTQKIILQDIYISLYKIKSECDETFKDSQWK